MVFGRWAEITDHQGPARVVVGWGGQPVKVKEIRVSVLPEAQSLDVGSPFAGASVFRQASAGRSEMKGGRGESGHVT